MAMSATSYFNVKTSLYRPKPVSTVRDSIHYAQAMSESTSEAVFSFITVPTPIDASRYPAMIPATTAYVDEYKPRTIHMERLCFGDKVLSIKSGLSLKVEVYLDDGNWIAFNERFGIYGFGASRQDALRDFQETFIEFYENIVNCPNENLGPSTIEFKTVLSSFATVV